MAIDFSTHLLNKEWKLILGTVEDAAYGGAHKGFADMKQVRELAEQLFNDLYDDLPPETEVMCTGMMPSEET